MNKELKETISEFIIAFEQVFDKDWNYTKVQLGVAEEREEQKQNASRAGLESIFFISPGGTFLNPKVEDETEDWGYRGKLLIEYRKLKNLISEL